MKLEIGVWQFVRIMVELEARARRSKSRRPAAKGRAAVYDDWREAWEELDNRLKELGARDQEAYADLMMNQNVVVKCHGTAQIDEVNGALGQIIETMKGEIDRGGPRGRLKDLRFESRELESLRQDLAARAGAKSRRKPRPSRGAARSAARQGRV